MTTIEVERACLTPERFERAVDEALRARVHTQIGIVSAKLCCTNCTEAAREELESWGPTSLHERGQVVLLARGSLADLVAVAEDVRAAVSTVVERLEGCDPAHVCLAVAAENETPDSVIARAANGHEALLEGSRPRRRRRTARANLQLQFAP